MLSLPFLGALCLLLTQEASAPPALELLDHAHLTSELHAIAEASSGRVQLHKLGTSRAGRAIEALRFGGEGGPAILLVANLDGARVFSSAVALQHARALAAGEDEGVRALLSTTTVWIVPRANPDAAEGRFARPRGELRASGPGLDDDRDGRQGEDPPADVNGDGVITWIRVTDPDGEWREDATDPRALVKADRVKGERGVWRLWVEGRDADGDEQLSEDAPLDARVDRNFPDGWDPHVPGAGVFPTDEPETRALCDFVLAHPELALVVVYDDQDTLVGETKGVGDEAPPVKRIPPAGVLESDAKLLNELGKRYRKITEAKAEGESDDRGTFGRWCYQERGLLVLSAALWDIPLEEAKKPEEPKKDEAKDTAVAPAGDAPSVAVADADKAEKAEKAEKGEKGEKSEKSEKKKGGDEPKPSDDAKRLRWIDSAGPEEAWRFVPWTAFQHPELGAVEIGGLAPYARLEPPARESGVIAAKHLEWFLTLGALLPRVTLAECTRETLAPGLTRITAVLENDAYLPLLTRSERRTGTTRPARVELVLPEAGTRLAGDPIELVRDLPGSGGRAEFKWLVSGPPGMEIAVRVDSAHAGKVTSKAEEKQR